MEQLEERRLLYAGMLDHAFGTDGFAGLVLNGETASSLVHTTAVALQADGKIVVAGYDQIMSFQNGGLPEAFIARFNADGSLDSTFNSGGSQPGVDQFGIPTLSFPAGLAFQPGGKILVVGDRFGGIAVNRLNPDGSLDNSFDNNQGAFVLNATNTVGFSANAVALQNDGKIVVAGSESIVLGNTDFLVVRLNSDGTPDVGFGFFGATGTDFPSGNSIDVAQASSVAIAPDGTIVAGGFSAIGMSTVFTLARYNPDGSPDEDFNPTGRVTTNITGSSFSTVSGVSVQPDGKIVAGGYVGLSQSHFELARYLPNGSLDNSFGVGGLVETSFHGSGQQGDAASSLALQPDGKIVVAGSSDDGPFNGFMNFALARYNPNGSLDSTFNFGGLVTTDYSFGNEDRANALAIQPDGKIVAVGDGFQFGVPDAALIRYDGDAGQLQLSSPSVTVNENAGSIALQVTRTNGASGPVTVDYAMSDGTATAGADYTANVMSGTIMFGDGQTGSIPIPAGIIDDATLEGGRETFRVTLSNPTGGAILGSPSSETVTILDPDMVVNPINAIEGQPFSGIVATFKGSNPSVPMGDYAATIFWGDLQSSAGTITPDPNGGFDVSGTHTYAEEGNYGVFSPRVIITGADNLLGSIPQVLVADAPLTASGVGKIHVTGGVPFTGTVATFSDADQFGTQSDYTAVIDWGDGGPTSTGIISGTGPFTVTGSHTYASFSGTKTLTVTITDAGGSKASTTDNVTDPTLPNSIVAMSSQTGQWWVAQSNGSGFTTTMWAAWNPNVTWVDMVSGDFTGNGKTDFAARDLHSGQWWVALSTGSSFTTSMWTAWNPNVTWVDVRAGDFTGDGKFDIAGRVLQTGQWWIAESTGSGFTNSLWTTWNPRVTWVDVSVGDFNGDGLADVAGRVLQSGQWWVAQSTGASFNNVLYATWNPNVSWVDVRVGDFNGDGMDDIVGRVQQNGQWWMAQSTGSTIASSLWGAWSPNVTWVDVQVGDFTGDGQLDIIGRVLQTGQWWLAQSTGSGFTNHLWGAWSPSVNWVDVQIGDFNGDGKADIAGRIQGTGQWWTSLSTGSGFTTSLWANWSSAVTWTHVSGGDYA